MAAPRLPASTGASKGTVRLRFALAALTLVCCLPAPSRALAARVRWGPSLDARVQG
jgi:hypothetical protein